MELNLSPPCSHSVFKVPVGSLAYLHPVNLTQPSSPEDLGSNKGLTPRPAKLLPCWRRWLASPQSPSPHAIPAPATSHPFLWNPLPKAALLNWWVVAQKKGLGGVLIGSLFWFFTFLYKGFQNISVFIEKIFGVYFAGHTIQFNTYCNTTIIYLIYRHRKCASVFISVEELGFHFKEKKNVEKHSRHPLWLCVVAFFAI